jgi:xylose isomerase
VDLFYAHIGGMDAFARGLKNAAKMVKNGVIPRFIKKRYSGWGKGLGQDIENGKMDFSKLEAYALKHEVDTVPSGRQEMLENALNECI